jgi:hypothetical protein
MNKLFFNFPPIEMNLQESHAKCFVEAKMLFESVQISGLFSNSQKELTNFTNCVSKNFTKNEKDKLTQMNKKLMLKNQLTQKYLKMDEELSKMNHDSLEKNCFALKSLNLYCGENNLFGMQNFQRICKDLIRNYQICELSFQKKDYSNFLKCWENESLEGKSFKEIDEKIANCLNKI